MAVLEPPRREFSENVCFEFETLSVAEHSSFENRYRNTDTYINRYIERGGIYVTVEYLEVEHAVLLVLRAEARLKSREAAAGLLPAADHLAARALDVHHVVQLVQPATPADAVPVVTVTVKAVIPRPWGGGGGGYTTNGC